MRLRTQTGGQLVGGTHSSNPQGDETMSDEPLPGSEIILYQTEDGRTRIQCRFENETLWLTQAQIAELFQTTPQNVTLHLKAIFAEGELVEAATCKDYLQVRSEGGREVTRKLRHYRLESEPRELRHRRQPVRSVDRERQALRRRPCRDYFRLAEHLRAARTRKQRRRLHLHGRPLAQRRPRRFALRLAALPHSRRRQLLARVARRMEPRGFRARPAVE